MRSVLCALLLLGAGSIAAGAAGERERLARLDDTIEAVDRWLVDAAEERDSLTAALADAERRHGALRAEARVLDFEITAIERELADHDAAIAESTSSVRANADVVARLARATYRLGSEPQLKLLLTRRDPDDIARTMTYFSYFARDRQSRIDELRATLDALGTLRETAAAERGRLAERRAASTEVLRRADQARTRREAALEDLANAMADENYRREQLEAEREELADLIARLDAEALDGASFRRASGAMPWPVDGRLLARFGDARDDAGAWRGWYFAAERGATVRAVHAGRIVFADWLRGYGLMVIISHGGGYMSLYAHNETLLEANGSVVETGQPVALAGDTGGQRSTGLYFEVRHNGEPSDPVCCLAKR